jgi:hypothetical protein
MNNEEIKIQCRWDVNEVNAVSEVKVISSNTMSKLKLGLY